MNKKGQLTIFIIVALVIVAAVIVFFAATDYGKNIIRNITGQETDFNSEVRNCIDNNQEIKSKVKLIMSQGGSLDPENFILYNNTRVEYLCYINEYYKGCVMQKGNLIGNTETEIKNAIQNEVKNCFDSSIKSLESRGYNVKKGVLNLSVDLLPQRISIDVNYPISVEKSDSSQSYSKFDFSIDGKYYQLISVSTSILNFEARYGDSETLTFMTLYPYIKVQKSKLSDGSTVYVLSDRNSDAQFGFAVRSFAWPPGYRL